MSRTKRHFDKIMDLIGDLDVNWDGEGAEPISEEVMQMTKDVFLALMDAWNGNMEIPSIMPLANGSIDLYWATRISKEELWRDDNLKSQLLLNISYVNGDHRISCNGAIDVRDKNADTISFIGDHEQFLSYDLASLQRFQND